MINRNILFTIIFKILYFLLYFNDIYYSITTCLVLLRIITHLFLYLMGLNVKCIMHLLMCIKPITYYYIKFYLNNLLVNCLVEY